MLAVAGSIIEVRVLRCRTQRSSLQAIAVLLAGALAGCAVRAPLPPNPFLGTWSTAGNNTVTIREDTVVEHQPDGVSTPLDDKTCNDVFSFRFAVWKRQAISALLPRQPNLDESLSQTLVAPSYKVALLRCDRGDHTYVMVNSGELLAIYRDGDIGVVERLARR